MKEKYFLLPLLFLGQIMQSCNSSSGGNSSSDSLFDITVSLNTSDSLKDYLIPVDLLALDQSFTVRHGEDSVLIQLDDRNNNGVADKLFVMIDLPEGGTKTLHAIPGEPTAQKSQIQLLAALPGGEHVDQLTFPGEDDLQLGGIVMENEWLAYRLLSFPPYNFDIIGKVYPELILDTIQSELSILKKWGGDILDESNSLGIASPAIYNFDEVVPFDQFDSREVTVRSKGPLYAEVYQLIKGVPIRGEKIDVGITWSMQANKHWAQVEIELLSTTNLNLQFAFGLPRHEEADAFIQGKKGSTQFAYTYGLQSEQGEQLGMAVMVPEIYDLDLYRDDPHNHFFMTLPVNNKVQYRYLAAWVKGRLTIFDEVDFVGLIRKYAQEYSVQPTTMVKYANRSEY